jgi:hypothetical protein
LLGARRGPADFAAALPAAGVEAPAGAVRGNVDTDAVREAFDTDAVRGAFDTDAVRGAFDTDAVAAAATPGSRPRGLRCRMSNTVPPTASTTGHSIRPAAPRAANVNAAAGVERLPLSSPARTPVTVPRTPPTTPETAAPPTAPATAEVALAARVTTRVALLRMFIGQLSAIRW